VNSRSSKGTEILYSLYEGGQVAMLPVRLTAGLTQSVIDVLPRRLAGHPVVRRQSAWCQLMMHTKLSHESPPFGIDSVHTGGRDVTVTEEVAGATPFGRLLHFAKDCPGRGPTVLVVAPLSGHFATLLRETVRTMLRDHDVYMAEWANARDVPVGHGRFGLDEYIEHVMRWLERIGPPAHVLAVCQPGPAALAATALLAAEGSPATPRSLTLMASPIDTSSSPNDVNRLATTMPLEWFETNVVMPVPPGHPGFGRRVYPGFLQLTSFVSMNLDRHVDQHLALFRALAEGRLDEAESIRKFYDEYFAVLDMDADYYLDTLDAVFQRNLLAKGELTWRGVPVDPTAITETALLTVEGERDDVCGIGQTLAAHDLLSSVRASRKKHYLQVGAGHYGVFSGQRWNNEVYPMVREHIMASG
jgi:poly(3-hydroxybutyrate) depolymerase